MADNTHDHRLRLPELLKYREDAARRRAAQFCDVPGEVCGCPALPITPRTFSMLQASGNRFVCPGGHPQIEDVVDFLWFHAPNYSPAHVRGAARKKRRHLRPLMRRITQPWRRWTFRRPDSAIARVELLVAIVEIRRTLAEAFADTVSANRAATVPIAALEAHLVDAMAADYGWDPDRTRGTPIGRLLQLQRCRISRRGGEVRDPGEDEILYEHMKRRNDALRAVRDKAEV